MKIIVDNLIFEALKPSEFRQYMEVGRDLAMKRIGQIWSKLQAESIGSNRNGDRLYFNITEKVDFFDLEEIPISVEINGFFKENGFEIVDVKNNKAKNLKDGRIVSIMKVLESLRKVNPELVAKYIKEYDRERSLMLDKQGKIMVISKSAYDIAGMSTDRKWGSCMNIRDGIKREYVPLEIETGTLISYLISPSDKNINNPYARVLIKPYLNRNDETDVLYGVGENIVKYGKRDPEYIKALINLLDKAQGEKTGIFEINEKSNVDAGDKTVEVKIPDFNDYKKIPIEVLEKTLKGLNIKNYKINDDNSVDVDGDVYISKLGLKKIPIQFNHVSGDFFCNNNQLETLEGAPREVGDKFDCSYNELKSLEGAPIKVGGSFDCSDNQLKSLKGAPTKVGGNYYCYNNLLESLEGAPIKVGGVFWCYLNMLKNLEGAPREVGGDFNCPYNGLKSLEGAPTIVGGKFDCSYNKLKSLKGAPTEVGHNFWCFDNLLESLEGAPTKVGRDFSCFKNPKKFTKEDVKAVSDVKGEVRV